MSAFPSQADRQDFKGFCTGNAATVWVTFLLLTALHIYANVKAMRSLHLTSLNRPRVDILLESYSKGQVRRHATSRSHLLTPMYHDASMPHVIDANGTGGGASGGGGCSGAADRTSSR